MKKRKSVKQSKIIFNQRKTFENPKIANIRSDQLLHITQHMLEK